MVSWQRADVVVLRVIEFEYTAVKQIETGSAPGSRWIEERHNGLLVALRQLYDCTDPVARVECQDRWQHRSSGRLPEST